MNHEVGNRFNERESNGAEQDSEITLYHHPFDRFIGRIKDDHNHNNTINKHHQCHHSITTIIDTPVSSNYNITINVITTIIATTRPVHTDAAVSSNQT